MYELYTGADKVVPLPTQYTMKAYRERGDKTPDVLFIFRHDIWVTFTFLLLFFLEKDPRYPSDRGLNGNYRDRYRDCGTGLDGPGFKSLYSKRFFSSQKRPDRLRDPPSLLFSAYRGSFPGVKRPGPEVNYSPPSSTEVKNEWVYTSSPLYAFMAWTGKTLPFFRGSLNPTVDLDVDGQKNPW